MMQLQSKAFVLIILCIVFIDQSAGKVQQGTLNTEKNFVFLDNFAFGTENANLEYEISFPAVSRLPGYDLVIFDDTIGQWGSIRPHERTLTCSEKVSKITDSKYKISLTEAQNGCETVTVHKEKWLSCKGNIDFSTVKTPRHYFLHLTNCNGPRETTGIWNLEYKVHMTNGKGPFVREFSFDQRFILETDIGFLIAYLGILMIGTANYIALSKKHFLHVTYRLFYLSLILQVISLLLHCCAWGNFSQNGFGLSWVTDTADIIYCLSSILFVAILLLVSKGYSITRVEVGLFGSIKLTVFTLLYAAAYMMVLIYQNIIFDPRDIQDFYGSLAASGLIACRLAGFLWTLYGVIFTIKDHPSKIPFYIHFGAFFAIWYLAEPVNIYLAAYVIPKLDCTFITNGVQWATALLGHAYFLFLTRPGSINKRFPFHLPTRKVGTSMSFTDLDPRPHYIIPDDFFNVSTVGQPSTIIDLEIGQDTSKDCKSAPQAFHGIATPKATNFAVVAPAAASTATTQPTTCPVHLFYATSALKELEAKSAVSSSSETGKEIFEDGLKSEPLAFTRVATPKETDFALVAPAATTTATTKPTTCPVHLFLATSALKELEAMKAAVSSSSEAGEEPYELSPVIPFSSSFQKDHSKDISVMSLPTMDDSNTISTIPSSSEHVDETSTKPSSVGVDAFNKPLPGDHQEKSRKAVAKLPKLKAPGMARRQISHSFTPVQILPPIGKQMQSNAQTAWTESTSSKPEEKKPKHLKKLVKKAKHKLHPRQKEAVPTIITYLEV